MFTCDERKELRGELLRLAENDPRISGAAITGSAAAGREDESSDIDLAFAVKDASQVHSVLADWTVEMYERREAAHHIDVMAGAWIYRVFLLRSGLQVDLAFVPAADFRALGPTFRLVFGEAQEARSFPIAQSGDLIGYGWLYALHARSSIARGKVWQAEYMISATRDQGLALCCLRHGVSAYHGKGFDELPPAMAAEFEGAIVRGLEIGELWRAFGVAVARLIGEIRLADGALASRLEATLREMASPSTAG